MNTSHPSKIARASPTFFADKFVPRNKPMIPLCYNWCAQKTKLGLHLADPVSNRFQCNKNYF
jgi:hypothetical protein